MFSEECVSDSLQSDIICLLSDQLRQKDGSFHPCIDFRLLWSKCFQKVVRYAAWYASVRPASERRHLIYRVGIMNI